MSRPRRSKYDTGGVAYHGIDMQRVRRRRVDQALDEKVRDAMGLRHVGFIYCPSDWRRGPFDLWVACDGIEYVQTAPGSYVRRDSVAGASVCK